jgi:hypothetical protein
MLGWIIALPLEFGRFSLGISLTLLIAPIVALVNFFKSCFSNHEQTTSNHESIISNEPKIDAPDKGSINLSSLRKNSFQFNTPPETIQITRIITTIPDQNYDSALSVSP